MATPARAWAVLACVGAFVLLAAAPAAAGAFPGQNGRIAYEYLDTIYTIALGDPAGQRLVSHPDGGAEPSWSPRGDHVVFVSVRGGKQDLYVIDADGTDERRLTANDAIEEENPSWVDDNTVVFRADPDSGPPTFSTVKLDAAPSSTYALLRAATPEVVDNFTDPEVSANGELLFTEYFQVPGTSSFRSAAWTASGNGKATNVSGTVEPAWSGGWSPDGVHFLYSQTTPGCCDRDIFVDSAAGSPVNITNTPGRSEADPRFSPDGTMVVFGDPLGGDNLYVSAADGSGEVTLPTGPWDARNPDWQAIGGFTSPPDPAPAPAPDPGPESGASPLGLRLKAKARQSSKKAVTVRVACSQACSVTVKPKGKATVRRPGAKVAKRKLNLSTARAKLSSGKAKNLRLSFKGRTTKRLVGKTLATKKGKIALTLRAVATDGAGGRKVSQLRITLGK